MSGEQFDEWVEKFKPVANPDGESGFCFDGKHRMFETFGKELEAVLRAVNESPNRVWTIIEGDDGKLYVINGYHLVNRFGHFITEAENDGSEVCIAID